MDGDIPVKNNDNVAVHASTSSPALGANKRESQPSPSGNIDMEGRQHLFLCPYCYEGYEIGVLCSHLEDEHCYESKVAVCPICSTKVLKDMAGHITLQHSHLFKIQRWRPFRRFSTSSSTVSLLGRSLREFSLHGLRGPPPPPCGPSDPIVSTIMSSPDNHQEPSSHRRLEQVAAGLSAQERDEACLRAKFVQELVTSTLYR